VVGRSPGQLFWRRFRKDRFAIAGLVAITIMITLAIAAPWIADLVGKDPLDVDPTKLDAFGLPAGPSSESWFGVDLAGRDTLLAARRRVQQLAPAMCGQGQAARRSPSAGQNNMLKIRALR